jgi:DnaJ-class molecular chaperone
MPAPTDADIERERIRKLEREAEEASDFTVCEECDGTGIGRDAFPTCRACGGTGAFRNTH